VAEGREFNLQALRTLCEDAYDVRWLMEYRRSEVLHAHFSVLTSQVRSSIELDAEGHRLGWPFPLDVNILHDTFIWRRAFEKWTSLNGGGLVLELLPGSSCTIPLALVSAGYRGPLHRLDACRRAVRNCSSTMPSNVIEGDFFSNSVSFSEYSAVAGNHIIDDLMLWLWTGSSYYEVHSSLEMSRNAWEGLASSPVRSRIQREVIDRVRELALSLKTGSVLLLREYPSTFAVMNGLHSLVVHSMATFGRIAEELAKEPGILSYFDASKLPIAERAKAPGSLLCYRKT
jgi:hypothetical protein